MTSFLIGTSGGVNRKETTTLTRIQLRRLSGVSFRSEEPQRLLQ